MEGRAATDIVPTFVWSLNEIRVGNIVSPIAFSERIDQIAPMCAYATGNGCGRWDGRTESIAL
jgi:hypothetical protein